MLLGPPLICGQWNAGHFLWLVVNKTGPGLPNKQTHASIGRADAVVGFCPVCIIHGTHHKFVGGSPNLLEPYAVLCHFSF